MGLLDRDARGRPILAGLGWSGFRWKMSDEAILCNLKCPEGGWYNRGGEDGGVDFLIGEYRGCDLRVAANV
eukprot:9220960-Pyramimonas_sp.AAC.1